MTTTARTATAATGTASAHTIVDSPLGPLTLVTREGGLAGLYMTQQRHLPPQETFGPQVAVTDIPVLARTAEQMTAYFAGDITDFDIDLSTSGTPFQRRVWAALCDIPYGETVSYGELAAALGRPTASRAVGLANGKNPISIVVPCHRVVGADGSMTGYGGGLERKRWLLSFESRAQQPFLT
ncbi:methylated-DNA--[protein]-cysteine S-methyltransferase [Actinacidiphila bryophytorum]|uniref:methylated-DNA--[protein]-cysteine S-methyltransferase n=1 Tax=Actinacidiphila bryophytorum TaxID=1436133 RepID=UPI002176B884|nr:methylated-DNA--[protein]-cysteine S-methyltransferase [Actinacidiphila bryophytorum]UWE08055.1 methylated-DNA--[protein]-cysteine S-methyltransferase [Actinacidiphila bryophytorum]